VTSTVPTISRTTPSTRVGLRLTGSTPTVGRRRREDAAPIRLRDFDAQLGLAAPELLDGGIQERDGQRDHRRGRLKQVPGGDPRLQQDGDDDKFGDEQSDDRRRGTGQAAKLRKSATVTHHFRTVAAPPVD
jgi:hypothetical protein